MAKSADQRHSTEYRGEMARAWAVIEELNHGGRLVLREDIVRGARAMYQKIWREECRRQKWVPASFRWLVRADRDGVEEELAA